MAYTIDDLLGEDYEAPLLTSSNDDDSAAASLQAYGHTYNTPSFYASEEDRKAGKVMSDDDYRQAWEKANPAPEAPTMLTDDQQKGTSPSYSEILAEYERTDPQKQDKARKAKMNIAYLSDGISAIANLIGTAYGGSNAYDATKGMAATMQARYDKIDKQQEESRKNYYNLLMRQAAIDARAGKSNSSTISSINKANMTAYNAASKERLARYDKAAAGLRAERAYQSQQAWNQKNYDQRERIAKAPTTSTSTSTGTRDVIDSMGNTHTLNSSNTTTRTTRKKL